MRRCSIKMVSACSSANRVFCRVLTGFFVVLQLATPHGVKAQTPKTAIKVGVSASFQ